MINIFAKLIKLESINHALRLQSVNCCLKIYRMALKREKDAIEFQKDEAINCNRIFMLRMFNDLNQLYVKGKSF